METDAELYRRHLRDQAGAALEQAEEAERRAVRGSGYPWWFWLASGLGLAALPVSVHAGGWASDAVLVAGCALLLITGVLSLRDRRVHEQCQSLGARGWLREIATFLPALAALAIAVVVAHGDRGWGATAAGAALTFVAWAATGLLARRVSGKVRA